MNIVQQTIAFLFEEIRYLLSILNVNDYMVSLESKSYPYLTIQMDVITLIGLDFIYLDFIKLGDNNESSTASVPSIEEMKISIINFIISDCKPFHHGSKMIQFPKLQLTCLWLLRDLFPLANNDKLFHLLLSSLYVMNDKLRSSTKSINNYSSIKSYVLEWIFTMLNQESAFTFLFPKMESLISILLSLGNDKEEKIRILIGELFIKLLNMKIPSQFHLKILDIHQLSQLYSLCLMRLGDKQMEVRDTYLNVLSYFGPLLLLLDASNQLLSNSPLHASNYVHSTSHPTSNQYFKLVSTRFEVPWKNELQNPNLLPPSQLSLHQFQRTMQFLSQKSPVLSREEREEEANIEDSLEFHEWIYHIFYSSYSHLQREITSISKIGNFAESS